MGLVIGVIFILKKFCGKYELWYHRTAKQTLFGGIEFISMSIFYWATAHLLHNEGRALTQIAGEPTEHYDFRKGCSIASIIFISLYGVYCLVRWYFNSIAGLYMAKRILFSVILAASAYETTNGEVGNKPLVAALILVELVFTLLRIALEQPYLMRQKFFIYLEALLFVCAYLVMYLWNDTGVVTIYVSLILFFFIILFMIDLIDLYRDSMD